MDPDAQLAIAPHLDGGESLLWSGRPRQGLLIRRSDAFLIPFSLMWGGFAIFWEAAVIYAEGGWFMTLWGIPFVLVGIYLMVGRFFVDAKRRSRTFYGFTRERAIVVSGLFGSRIRSINLRTLTETTLDERADRSGTILFGPPERHQRASFDARESTTTFELIEEARSVYNRLRNAQKEAS